MLLRLFPVVIACSLIAYFYYRKQERLSDDQKLYMEALRYRKYKTIAFWSAFVASLGLAYVLYSNKYPSQQVKMESPSRGAFPTQPKSSHSSSGDFALNKYFTTNPDQDDDKPLVSRS